MKALILAGGFGTRLRPLSCTRPKLMFPIANRTLLDWIMEALAQEGVTQVVLAVNYMADALKRAFGSSKHGVEIVYSREKKPLGTGGPIKKAESLLREGNSPFLVLNGDIISSLNYSELFRMHQDFGGTGTIALHEVEDPTRFGVVELEGNRINRFVEKPSSHEAPSHLVNAGIYVLDPSVFDLIPKEKKVSMEREVFPIMVSRGGLYGYRFQGLWVDTGKPDDYFLANRLILDRIAEDAPVISDEAKVSSTAKIIPPTIIGDSVVIEDDACVGPYASIGDGVTLGKGTRVKNAILFPHTWIESYTSITGAIIGEGAILGRWVKVEDQCIIGDHVMIDDNVTLTKNVKICHNKAVSESILQPATIM
jgi:mannose-1-phosphate guanylyltransferase